MNKNVLMIHPPFKSYAFGKAWERTESATPPLGLMYLASPLVKNGFNVDFIDFNIDKLNKKDFIERVKKNDFFLISCYTHLLHNAKKIMRDIRRFNKNAVIICGGPHCIMEQEFIQGSDITQRPLFSPFVGQS